MPQKPSRRALAPLPHPWQPGDIAEPTMDDTLYFTEQHLAVREMVRAFAKDEVAPIAAQYDASAEFPWETIKRDGRSRAPRRPLARGATEAPGSIC